MRNGCQLASDPVTNPVFMAAIIGAKKQQEKLQIKKGKRNFRLNSKELSILDIQAKYEQKNEFNAALKRRDMT
jgi:hypothetical protein